MNLIRRSVLSVFVLAMLPTADSQTVSGSIRGTVADPSGSVVAGAAVQLTNQLTKQVRKFKTDDTGTFLFPNLVPGSYDLGIAQAGFKTFVQNGITVSAQERVDVHTLKLDVGDVSTSVKVSVDMVHVATDSSDRGISVNTVQIEDTPSRGRNYLDILRSLPGTQATTTNDSRGMNTGNGTAINGGQQGQVLVMLDGIASQDTTAPGTNGYATPSVDAIAEVKVLVSNYAAEYGARDGGLMTVTIKSGTSQFHGSAYYYFRHEELNANEWFNNANQVVKPRYRYGNAGATFGGPLLIPGTRFNRSRTKLFFFFSEDYLHNQSAGALNRYNMPTTLERSGDFSQTVTSTGKLIPILDPSTGIPFANNVIPATRISAQGYSLLNLFPRPFTTDPTGQRQYNTLYQWTTDNPREDRLLRVDYNIGQKTLAYVRLIQDWAGNHGNGTTQGPLGSGWG
jgi:Carboxypeptidase regulatory-like domain/TonB-dependent Receptor Plug Domain